MTNQKLDKSIKKTNSLPSALYLKLSVAADILSCTVGELLHCAATERLVLITPVPASENVYVRNWSENVIDIPSESPDFLALSVANCRTIELLGSVAAEGFPRGYEVTGQRIEAFRPFRVCSEAYNQKEGRFWEYCLLKTLHGEGPVSKIVVDPGCLWVLVTELQRFIACSVSDDPLVDDEANRREVMSSVNRSDEVAAINRAFTQFWANADRDDKSTHAGNAEVAAWLVKHHGFAQTPAEQVASLIRPKWASRGRKPEK